MPALVAAGSVAYLLPATVLLVVDAERALLLALTPGLPLAAAGAAGLPLPPAGVGAGLALLLAATCAAALRSAPRSADGRPLSAALARGDLRLAGLHAAVGACTALLLSYAALDTVTGYGSAHSSAVALATGPLVVCLGVADLLVHRLRSAAGRTLDVCTSRVQFAQQARRGLLHALGRQVLALLVVTAAVAAGLRGLGNGPDPVLSLHALTGVLLGAALLLCMLLLSLGRGAAVLAVTGAALLADTAARVGVLVAERAAHGAGGLASGLATGTALAGAHAVVAALLLGALLPVALATTATPTRHR